MSEGYISSDSQALINAAITAERAHLSSLSWHDTVEDMILPGPATSFPSSEVGCPPSAGPVAPVDCYLGPDKPFNPRCRPIKTGPPPKAISVNNAFLTERIDSLQKLALVGKWHFPLMKDSETRQWLSDQWSPILGYTPIISLMMKDWYSFHFLKEKDLEVILGKPWVKGRSFLYLSRWYMGFDPLKNTPSNSLIWAKLPNLPLELWSSETLSEIGNSIGKFIYVDPWCRGERDKRIAWILIDKPFKGTYPEYIDILWEGLQIRQRIDFWGIPFRCSRCHHTGHLIKDCKFRPRRKHLLSPSAKKSPRGSASFFMSGDNPDRSPSSPVSKEPKADVSHPQAVIFSSPIPLPTEDFPVPSPPDMSLPNIKVGSRYIMLSSSPSTPSSPRSPPPNASVKGKEPASVPSPGIPPSRSTLNALDSDVVLFIQRNPLAFEPLTIHKPPGSSISPNSACNITVRKKKKGDSRHFRGRTIASDLGITNLSLVEVPISESDAPQPLRASKAGQPSR